MAKDVEKRYLLFQWFNDYYGRQLSQSLIMAEADMNGLKKQLLILSILFITTIAPNPAKAGLNVWTSNEGPTKDPLEDVRALVIVNGVLYAGTSTAPSNNNSVYQYDAGTKTWLSIGSVANGLADTDGRAVDIYSLLFYNNTFIAGTYGSGVFQYDATAKTWSNIGYVTNGLSHTHVNSLFSFNNTLVAGTSGGVYQYDANTKTWSNIGNAANGLTSDHPVSGDYFPFLSFNNTLVVGTALGVYQYDAGAKTWSSIGGLSNGLNPSCVTSLVSFNNTLVAGTHTYGVGGSVFQYDAGAKTWSNIGKAANGLADTEGRPTDVTSLPFHNNTLVAGTSSNGVFQYDPNSKTWSALGNNKGLESLVIMSLLEGGNLTLYAGTYPLGVYEFTQGCGNGVVEENETCDGGEGCSATCQPVGQVQSSDGSEASLAPNAAGGGCSLKKFR